MIQTIPYSFNKMGVYRTGGSTPPEPPTPTGQIDYKSTPMTFECISGTATVSFPLYNSNNRLNVDWGGSNSPISSLNYRKFDGTNWGSWTDWKADNFAAVTLTEDQKIELSGVNGPTISRAWGQNYNRFVYAGTGRLILYGNISSLFDPSVEEANLFNMFYQGEDSSYETSNVLADASKFLIPYSALTKGTSRTGGGMEGVFGGFNNNLSAVSLFAGTGYSYNQYSHLMKKNPKLMFAELRFITNSSNWKFSNWMDNDTSNGFLIISQNTVFTSKSTHSIPTQWTVLYRHSDRSLTYVETENGHTAGDPYTGEDPYAWYYNN